MDTNGLLCAATSAAYFKFLKAGAPVNLTTPEIAATIIGCYFVPMAYYKVQAAVPQEVMQAMASIGILGPVASAAGVSYGVARYLNI